MWLCTYFRLTTNLFSHITYTICYTIMKTYENIIKGVRYWYFYDIHIKSWTVFKVDKQNYQIGNAEHYANKKSLLKDYKFNFKNCV